MFFLLYSRLHGGASQLAMGSDTCSNVAPRTNRKHIELLLLYSTGGRKKKSDLSPLDVFVQSSFRVFFWCFLFFFFPLTYKMDTWNKFSTLGKLSNIYLLVGEYRWQRSSWENRNRYKIQIENP